MLIYYPCVERCQILEWKTYLLIQINYVFSVTKRNYTFIFLLYNRYIHTSCIHKHSPRLISICSQLSAQWAEPPWGAEPRIELKPAVQQASALPTEPRCTLKFRVFCCLMVDHSLLMSPILCFFERCLDSNPESCQSKQAHYQLAMANHR